MNLRISLKKFSKDLHDIIENQFPYNQLGESANIEENSQLCLICFKITFFKLLQMSKGEHTFFEEIYNSLYEVYPELNSKLLGGPESDDLIHLKYVFLGSRLGTNMLLKMNPQLSSVAGSAYFTNQLPLGIWEDFCEEASKIEDTAVIASITRKVNEVFQSMISLGLAIEASRN